MRDIPSVLLVEDSEADVLLVRRAFEKLGAKNRIEVARDGEQAIQYLAGEGEYEDRNRYPLPGLVFLDLKMPMRDGFEVLKWIKGNPKLRMLPVLVLTMSERREDKDRAYGAGASSFLTKPMQFEEFTEMMSTVKGFWLDYARVPWVE